MFIFATIFFRKTTSAANISLEHPNFGNNNPIHALRTYNLNFANSLETIYPKIDYRSGDLPKLLNSDFVDELLKLNSPEFLEQYAAFSSLIRKTDVTNELSLAVHDGIMFWIQRGQFLVALVYALRTTRVDVVSILLHAVLDEEDGFDQMRSKLIGNYLHRRVYSSKPRSLGFRVIYSGFFRKEKHYTIQAILHGLTW